MALIEAEGLILKTYSLAEADKIVVFLTPNGGLVRGVAKGAKRLKSRFGGALEPFSTVNITYFQKEERELVSINQIELKKSFFAKASNPYFLQKFAYLTELLVEFAPPSEPNERLYRMACVCLETVDENKNNLESIILYFEIWLLKLGGYLPPWDKCERCKRELAQNEDANLQMSFHLLCSNCQRGKSVYPIIAAEREIYITAQRISPTKFAEYTIDKTKQIKNVSLILKRIISQIIGKDIAGERIFAVNS